MKICILALMVALSFVACNTSVYKTQELDLSSHQFSLKVQAPEGASVTIDSLGSMTEMVIKKEDQNFLLKIIKQEALPSHTVASLKAESIKEKSMNSGFKIIEEQPDGYVYEIDWLNNSKNYNFFKAKIEQNITYTFYGDILGVLTKEQAASLYSCLK